MTRPTFVLCLLVCLASCGSGGSERVGGAAASAGGGPGSGGATGAAPPRSKSNVCPTLLLLDCTDPRLPNAPPLPLNADEGSIVCEVRFRDDDATCAQSCDPQTCSAEADGLTCTAGPDPGVSTTVVCLGAELDCAGDGTPDASCTIDSDILVGAPDLPGGPVECVEQSDCAIEGATCVAGFCDFSPLVPTLNANFYVSCPARGTGGAGGAVPRATCAAVTTDGDLDCDQQGTVEVPCASLE